MHDRMLFAAGDQDTGQISSARAMSGGPRVARAKEHRQECQGAHSSRNGAQQERRPQVQGEAE